MNEEREFLNFGFEVEGEFPIFIAIENDGTRDIKEMYTEAINRAIDIYELPAKKIKYLGAYDDDDAEEIGWDTY